MLKDIRAHQATWENYFNQLVPAVDQMAKGVSEEEARRLLTKFSCDQAEQSTQSWKELGQYLLVKYMDGVVKEEKDGKFVTNEAGIPEKVGRLGYPEDYLRLIAPTEKKEININK